MPFEPIEPKQQTGPTLSLTMDQIMEIVRAIKEPSPAEKEKLAQEEELKKRQLDAMMELGRTEEQAKIDRENACGHKKENGSWCIGGQEHSDGMIHPVCLRCGKSFPPYKAQHGAQGIPA